MTKMFTALLVAAIALTACGGDGADPLEAIQDAANQPTGDIDAGAATGSGSGGIGTLENPTPEGSGALPGDSFRIGDTVWERTVPITRGQCFVQDGEGVAPFAAWGTLNDDDSLEFSVSYDADTDSSNAQVRSDTMFWAAGNTDGSYVTVDHDFATLTIAGDGLFYNLHNNEWAYGSFQFTCEPG